MTFEDFVQDIDRRASQVREPVSQAEHARAIGKLELSVAEATAEGRLRAEAHPVSNAPVDRKPIWRVINTEKPTAPPQRHYGRLIDELRDPNRKPAFGATRLAFGKYQRWDGARWVTDEKVTAQLKETQQAWKDARKDFDRDLDENISDQKPPVGFDKIEYDNSPNEHLGSDENHGGDEWAV